MVSKGIDREKLEGLKSVSFEKVDLDYRDGSVGYQVRGITLAKSGGRSVGRGLGIFEEKEDALRYCGLIRDENFDAATELTRTKPWHGGLVF